MLVTVEIINIWSNLIYILKGCETILDAYVDVGHPLYLKLVFYTMSYDQYRIY